MRHPAVWLANIALTVVLGCALVPIISNGVTSSAAVSGGHLTILDEYTYSTLDPASPLISPQPAMLLPVFDPLFSPKRNGTVAPDLATGYSISKNGLTITITLHRGVHFQDGTDFNASAVKFNLERYANPSQDSQCLTYLSAISSITTPSLYTVVIHLSSKDPALINVLGSEQCALMASPTAVEREGSGFGEHPVGTGPFRYVGGTVGVTMNFDRWNGYWKGKPKLSSITIDNPSSSQTAFADIQAGSAQAWVSDDPGSARQVSQAQADKSLVVQESPASANEYVFFNFKSPTFSSVAARKAVAYATNARQIAKSLYDSHVEPTESLFPPADPLGYMKSVPGYPAYNPAKASQLVKQLGGLSFTLEVTDTSEDVTLAEALQSEWAQAGIKATIDQLATPAWLLAIHQHTYEASMGPDPAYNDPAPVSERFFYSTSQQQQNELSNAEVNKLILEGNATSSPTARRTVYEKLNTLLSSTIVPRVELFAATTYTITSKAVTGLLPNSFGFVPWSSVEVG